jgi:hypothetical protein
VKASIIELPSFMHIRPPRISPSFANLMPHFQNNGVWSSGLMDKSSPPRVPDLITILFLGIGMLGLGSLKKRMDSDHHITAGHHADRKAPRHL